MASRIIRRQYPIPDLTFADFNDICRRFQQVHEQYRQVYFTVDGHDAFLVLDEPDPARVMDQLVGREDGVRKYSARFYTSRTHHTEGYGISELQYRPKSHGRFPMGLSFFSDTLDKAAYFLFDEEIRARYTIVENPALNVEFGKPCEVIAAVVDIRGFSEFCEQPNIESPYICGLMSAFYGIVNRAFQRFPPEGLKILGDGVIAIWETTPADRGLVVQIALDGALSLTRLWRGVRQSPNFSHGAPEGIGVGISFGLASHLQVGDDYIGRPVNIASRLCGACPAGLVYVDCAVPGVPPHLEHQAIEVPLKPYGKMNTRSFRAAIGHEPAPA